MMNAISRMSPPQLGHARGNSSPTRAKSLAQAIRDVSVGGGLTPESQYAYAAWVRPACPHGGSSPCFAALPIAGAVTAGRSG